MSSPISSPSAIQKPKNKRTVLPKTSLIQLYIKNPDSSLTSNQTTSKCPRVLPKLNNQDVVRQLNLLPNTEINPTISNIFISSPAATTTTALSSSPRSTNTNTLIKKCTKDKKINEITRLCLNQPNETKSLKIDPSSSKTASDQEETGGLNSTRSKQNIFNFLAKEFFLDCRQRLEANSFKLLLQKLNEHKQNSNLNEPDTQKQCLNSIYELIKADKILCNKFSVFLTSENSLIYDLFMQTSQYEKCYELLSKLELFIPNKSTFKKLIQLIVSTANLASESDTVQNRIDEIKAKIKAITKNNSLINSELDYLFDQRWANLEPSYEKISLVPNSMNMSSEDSNKYMNEEFIDLSSEYPSDYGTKKCSCKCHSVSQQNDSNANSSDDLNVQTTSLAAFNNHCLLCSLKLIKGKLCIKCEGKKAVPVGYRID